MNRTIRYCTFEKNNFMKTIKKGLVRICKSKDKWGWMGNIGKCALEYEGKKWKSSEGLFISMRFDDEKIIEELRELDNGGMMVKMVSKKFKDQMIIVPGEKEDIENMRKVVRLKINSYPWMKESLKKCKGKFIYEDVVKRKNNKRSLIWGGYFEGGVEVINGEECGIGEFIGENILGKIWMDLRDEILINRE